ncbi:MAG: peptidylprolyl isomerase [Clostridia bacterium]|nr:peptidylprolyl isomerase [Clostridia bacterium]
MRDTEKDFSHLGKGPRVVITLQDGRTMTAVLYPDVAPLTVENFLTLVDQKAYDGVIFHRVIPGFMVQTGYLKAKDNQLTGAVNANTIPGEFTANGFVNELEHKAGVLSMARAEHPDSASSQFFICVERYAYGDGNYAAFGELVNQKSLDVAVSISRVLTGAKYMFERDVPIEDVIIKSIRRK